MAATNVLAALTSLLVTTLEYGLAFTNGLEFLSAAIRYGIRVYPGSLSGQLWLRADVFILNFFAGTAAVGQYSLVSDLAQKVWVLDHIRQVTFDDRISLPREESTRLAARTTRNILFVTGLLAITIAIVSPVAIPLLFGSELEPAVVPLIILLPGVVAIATSRPISASSSGSSESHRSRLWFHSSPQRLGLPCTSSNPEFGASGAALGSTVAYLVPLLILVPMFSRPVRMPVREVLLVDRRDSFAGIPSGSFVGRWFGSVGPTIQIVPAGAHELISSLPGLGPDREHRRAPRPTSGNHVLMTFFRSYCRSFGIEDVRGLYDDAYFARIAGHPSQSSSAALHGSHLRHSGFRLPSLPRRWEDVLDFRAGVT